STCRVECDDDTRGSGFVFKEEKDDYLILTAGHVVHDKKDIKVRFFHGRAQSQAFPVQVIKEVLDDKDDIENDLGVVRLTKKGYNYDKPTVIKLGDKVDDKKPLFNCGCALGSWPISWRGYTVDYPPDNLVFYPTAIPG